MGIFTDFAASAKTIDMSLPPKGASRPLYAAIDALRDRVGDRNYTAGFDSENKVHSIGNVAADDDGSEFYITRWCRYRPIHRSSTPSKTCGTSSKTTTGLTAFITTTMPCSK